MNSEEEIIIRNVSYVAVMWPFMCQPSPLKYSDGRNMLMGPKGSFIYTRKEAFFIHQWIVELSCIARLVYNVGSNPN